MKAINLKKIGLVLCAFVLANAMFGQSFGELKAAAEKGDADADALYELSSRYAGIDDYENAFVWLKKSAELGNARAYTDLAQIYFQGGCGQPVDVCKGYDCIINAAKISNADDLQLMAGVLYMIDEAEIKKLGCTNIKRDLNEAEKCFRKVLASDYNSFEIDGAKEGLGDIYYERKNYAEAAKWYVAVETSNAQNKLGWMYENGLGVPKNTKKAIELYRNAAEQGNEEANDRLEKLTGERVVVPDYNDEPIMIEEENQSIEDESNTLNNKGVEYYNQGNYAEAIKYYRQAAEMGNATAQGNLGWCYLAGEVVEKNYAEAEKWLRKSAEQEYVQSYLNLGFLCESSKADYTEAAKWYRKAAEQGDAVAQGNLGWCYQKGKGVELDLTESLKWFLKAAEQDNARGQYNAGLIYHFRKNYAEAEKWYKAAAEYNFDDVYYRLGLLYDDKKDYVEALQWYKKAAEQEHIKAQIQIGLCYENGIGIKQNETEAAKWYRKAAEQGDATAQTKLGELLLEGEDGGKHNLIEAIKWLKKAAAQDESFAMRDLGSIYKIGYDEVKKDLNEAAKWYRKSAELGNNDGMIFLAELILYDAVKGDYAEAVKLLKKVEANGYNWSYGQYLTGMAYEEGKGVQANKQEAIKWYNKAAEQGNEEAKERLIILNSQSLEGCIFESENGVLSFIFKATNKADVWDNNYKKTLINNEDYWYNATTQKGEYGGLPFTILGNKLTMTMTGTGLAGKTIVFMHTKGKIPPKPADNSLEGCVFELNMLNLIFKANNKFETRAGSGTYTYNLATQTGELNFTNTIVGEVEFTETFKISGNKLTMTNMDKTHTLTLTKGKIPK